MKKTAVLLVCIAAALTLAAGCRNVGAPAVTTVVTTMTTAPMTTAPIITTFTTPEETTVMTETEPGATS